MINVRSIRHFILITVLLTVIGGGLFSAYANYEDSKEQVEELFDAELAQMARVLQSVFNNPLTPIGKNSEALIYEDFNFPNGVNSHTHDGNEISDDGHKYEKKLAFQVWGKEGGLILQSRSAYDVGLLRQEKGYHSVVVDRVLWRLFTLPDRQSGRWIQVAQREDVRTELTEEITEHLLMVPLIVTPLLAVVIWYFVGVAFTPLKRLSEDLSERHMGNLTPVDEANIPDEIRGLVTSINALFSRVKEQALTERRFTSDAAHELRTPLAAIKVQLQNTLRRVDNEKAADSVKKSLKALNRMIGLVEQLLLLSRLDATEVLENSEPVLLNATINSVIEELDFQLVDKQIRLNTELSTDVIVEGHDVLLHSLVKNFLDNAVRYTPDNSEITLTLNAQELVIEDSGPGIPETEIGAVFNRFYRVEGDCSQGEGLGLAICQKIARLYGCQLQLENQSKPKTGLRVRLIFNQG